MYPNTKVWWVEIDTLLWQGCHTHWSYLLSYFIFFHPCVSWLVLPVYFVSYFRLPLPVHPYLSPHSVITSCVSPVFNYLSSPQSASSSPALPFPANLSFPLCKLTGIPPDSKLDLDPVLYFWPSFRAFACFIYLFFFYFCVLTVFLSKQTLNFPQDLESHLWVLCLVKCNKVILLLRY